IYRACCAPRRPGPRSAAGMRCCPTTCRRYSSPWRVTGSSVATVWTPPTASDWPRASWKPCPCPPEPPGNPPVAIAARIRHRLDERLAAWVLRRQGADSLPVEIGRRRLYVLPTRAGIGFGVLLFG